MEIYNIFGSSVSAKSFVDAAIADLNKFYPGKNLKLWVHRNKPYTEPDGKKFQVGIRVEERWTDIVSEVFYESTWATQIFNDAQRILSEQNMLSDFKGREGL